MQPDTTLADDGKRWYSDGRWFNTWRQPLKEEVQEEGTVGFLPGSTLADLFLSVFFLSLFGVGFCSLFGCLLGHFGAPF